MPIGHAALQRRCTASPQDNAALGHQPGLHTRWTVSPSQNRTHCFLAYPLERRKSRRRCGECVALEVISLHFAHCTLIAETQ